MQIRPYILAGGKSSRMGRDKAMVELEGKTLLARAVEMLRGVAGLGEGTAVITVLGGRESLEGADRSIVDCYRECGPLGGIEAALHDLQGGNAAEWAFFTPVDMPLLSVEFIEGLLVEWSLAIAADPSIKVGLVEFNGELQPLLSLVHCSLHSRVRNALEKGQFKVATVLESDGTYRTSVGHVGLHGVGKQDDRCGTSSSFRGGVPLACPTDQAEKLTPSEDYRETYAQFTNVNTEADLMKVATLLKRPGSLL